MVEVVELINNYMSLYSKFLVKMIQGRPITLNLTSGKTVLLPSTALKKTLDQQPTEKTDPNVSFLITFLKKQINIFQQFQIGAEQKK